MTFDERALGHRERCRLHMIRLRMLSQAEAGVILPRQVTAEVREATNAVIAEAEAAGRDALAAMPGSRRQPEAETFLWVRLARLAGAADDAVSAARRADAPGLRRQLDRFDALTTAIWAVQQAVANVAQPTAASAIHS